MNIYVKLIDVRSRDFLDKGPAAQGDQGTREKGETADKGGNRTRGEKGKRGRRGPAAQGAPSAMKRVGQGMTHIKQCKDIEYEVAHCVHIIRSNVNAST